jgi:hypothetical protein
MVKVDNKAIVKFKKPVVHLNNVDILTDRYWYDEFERDLQKLSKEFKIKQVGEDSKYVYVEFQTAKMATMYRLKYGKEIPRP